MARDEYWNRFEIEFVPGREDIRGLVAYSGMDNFMEDNLEGDPDLPFSYLDLEDEALYLAEDESDTVVIQSLGKLAAFSGKFADYEWHTLASNARELETSAEVVEYLSGEDLETQTVSQAEIDDKIGEKRSQASDQDGTFHRRRVDLDYIHDASEDDLR